MLYICTWNQITSHCEVLYICTWSQIISYCEMLYICTWNQLRLVREWLAEARDCNWSRYDQSLRERTWEVSGTICNTKTPCEDVFGDAMDKGKRGNKNGKISDWRLYWTMCNSEHASESHHQAYCYTTIPGFFLSVPQHTMSRTLVTRVGETGSR